MKIKTEQDEIQNYLSDASNLKGFADAVYFPENEEDIKAILSEANRSRTPVTISGNGTGLTGARIPKGGIVISTEKLNRILEINSGQGYVLLQPGVIFAELQKSLKEKRLFYPPDPTETNCFIGGTIATNASGARTFKYGPTRNFVSELDVLLANGASLKLKRSSQKAENLHLILKDGSGEIYNLDLPEVEMPHTKNASGYFCKKNMDAIDLFIGSEGTLGVITKAKLKVLPLPEDVLSCVVFFNEEQNALAFLEKARDSSFKTRKESLTNSIDALALEFFDENSLKFLSPDFPNIPADAKAAVWFEQEVTIANRDILLEKWIELISEFAGDEENAWFGYSEADREKIKDFRHAISENVNEYIAQNNFRKLGTDVAVPDDKFRELYYYSKDEVEKAKLQYVVYGHFGNSHMHLNMLPKSEKEFAAGKIIYHSICKKAIDLRGTISAEHGVGKAKVDYLLEMYGRETIRKMAEIKKKLDPKMILGRGNIFNPDDIL